MVSASKKHHMPVRVISQLKVKRCGQQHTLTHSHDIELAPNMDHVLADRMDRSLGMPGLLSMNSTLDDSSKRTFAHR
jgi:hypothetical protein